MDIEILFAGIPVSDFEAARAWYERFFDRPPDIIAHEQEVMWRVTEGGWLYILYDANQAGKSIVAMAVTNIENATSALEARGVRTGPITPEGDAGRKSVVLDPDGNSIAMLQVAAAA
jgi:glyoxylase I family protein